MLNFCNRRCQAGRSARSAWKASMAVLNEKVR